MKNLNIALVASAVILAGSAHAATDGAVGDAVDGSTGSSLVTIVKDNAVQISKVDDIDFGNQSTLTADAVASDQVCVFASTGGYNITASGDGVGNAFTLSAGGTSVLPYSVRWNEGAVTSTLLPGAPATGFVGNSAAADCGGTGDANTNASFEVTIDQTNFNMAAAGTYSGTLTLKVMPE